MTNHLIIRYKKSFGMDNERPTPKMQPRLNVLSLREQVYEYLRQEMTSGSLVPGSAINLNKIAAQLGISKTPCGMP